MPPPQLDPAAKRAATILVVGVLLALVGGSLYAVRARELADELDEQRRRRLAAETERDKAAHQLDGALQAITDLKTTRAADAAE